jgi:hypothetical protein
MINFPDLNSLLMKVILEPRQAAGKTNPTSTFTKGEVLQGTVVKSLGTDSSIIRLGGIDMVASTPQKLAAGAQITVRVEQTMPQFVVSLLPGNTPVQEKAAALLRMYLPSENPIASVINKINALLPALPPAALRGTGLEKVLNDLNKSVQQPGTKSKNPAQLLGFFHEAELLTGKPGNNLKQSLLILRDNLEILASKDLATGGDGLYKKVNEAISNIELRQLMGVSEKGDMKGWPIPYWNGQTLDTGMLYIGKDDKEKGGKKKEMAVRISLMVKMSNLGEIRADAIAFNDKLEGTIYASSDGVVKALSSGVSVLVGGLSNAGYTANFTVQKASREFLTEPLKPEGVFPVENLLNLRV